MTKTKEYFELPHLKLHRDDLKDFTNRKFTDTEMQEIAEKLSESFMNDWHDNLAAIMEEYEEE